MIIIKELICLDCDKWFEPDDARGRCPHCNAMYSVVNTQKIKRADKSWIEEHPVHNWIVEKIYNRIRRYISENGLGYSEEEIDRMIDEVLDEKAGNT